MSAALAMPLDGVPAPTADAALMRAARGGDERAFADLVRRHAGPLHRYLVATGLPAHDADDVVQESFIRAHRALAAFDERWAVSTWLYTIAHRLRINRQTRARRHPPLEAVPEPHAAPDSAREPGRGDDAPVWELARRVLTERQAHALWLRYGEALEPREIGRVLGTSALNARVILHRARAALARHLRPEDL